MLNIRFQSIKKDEFCTLYSTEETESFYSDDYDFFRKNEAYNSGKILKNFRQVNH